MTKKCKKFLLLLLLTTFQFVLAQERNVSGVVKDKTGMPIPGASVVVKGTQRGTQTDFDGKFTISASPQAVLVVKFIGMKTLERVASSTSLAIVLEDDVQQLDEIVVVSYGTVRKEASTASVTSIKAESFNKRAITNISSALEGVSPGLQMSSANGQPGGNEQGVRIRGFSSATQSNAPLYVIDGVPGVGLNTINMMDVENLSVLKDAAATSLYGSRGANGVIIITTKKGKNGSSKFNFNVVNGLSERGIKDYERLDPGQFYETQWLSIRNGSLTTNPLTPIATANLNATNTVASVLGNYNPFNVPNNQIVGVDGKLNPNAKVVAQSLNWQEELERIGLRQQYDMSYSSGNEKSDMFVSLSYINEEGYIKNTDTERIMSRINANFSPKKWFKSGINISASHTLTNNANQDNAALANPIRAIRTIGSIYPVFQNDAQGNYILDGNGNRQFDRGDTRGSGATAGRNPVAEILWNRNTDKVINAAGRAYVTFNFFKHFKFTTNAGLDYRNINGIGYENNLIGDGVPLGRSRRDIDNQTRSNLNNLLEYKQTFNDFTVDVLLGQEYFHRHDAIIRGFKTGQATPNNDNLSSFVDLVRLNGWEDNYKLSSFLSRVNLEYQKKYFLSLSARQDQSSRFSPSERTGQFWAAGASWVISNEKFLENNKNINYLKLRGSAGTTGNDGDAFYGYQALYNFAFNGGEGGANLATIAPPFGLSWEKNFQRDIALEFGLFNVVNASVEYYHRETKDLIFDVPLPVSAGVSSYLRNIGDMYNNGFEVNLDFKIFNKKDFGWDLNINGTTVKNEITKLPAETPRIISGTKQLEVGRSINDFWLRSWYGVNPANGDPLYIPANENAADVITVNGTKVTNLQVNAKFDYQGSAIPDVFGGIRNNWRYKNFSLDVLLAYSIGGLIYDSSYATLMHNGNDAGRAFHVDILNSWRQPGDISEFPRIDRININGDVASSRFLTDASYLSIRSATLSFNVKDSFARRIGVDNMRFFATGENLWLFSKRQGMDPQQNFTGTVSNVFVPARIISWGLNVSF